MSASPSLVWQCGGRRLEFGRRPLVMGIVNVTPDSFSDGGRFADHEIAIEHGLKLVAEGADLLDIGGESTRPGSRPVPVEEEVRRVVPVVAGLARQTSAAVAVDTMKAEVARRSLDAGAAIINDVTGLRGDPEMPGVVAKSNTGVIVMHMQGTPATMQANPQYGDVVAEVAAFFDERLQALAAAGITRDRVCFDPGIGFGKNLDHNLDLLANLDALAKLGRPICLGVSRKGFIGAICGRPVGERLAGSLAVACIAAARGTAQILRVHDVAATRDAVRLLEAIDQHRR
jgi:dihydropteroate synthase